MLKWPLPIHPMLKCPFPSIIATRPPLNFTSQSNSLHAHQRFPDRPRPSPGLLPTPTKAEAHSAKTATCDRLSYLYSTHSLAI